MGSQVVYFTCQTKPELVCLEIHRQTLGAVIMSLGLAARPVWVQIDPSPTLILLIAHQLLMYCMFTYLFGSVFSKCSMKELSTMMQMLYISAVQCGSSQLRVATEHLKYIV